MSVLEVNLNEIKENLLDVKKLLKNNQKVCFVAKANCYGLGAKIVCPYVEPFVDYFAVSSTYEFFKIQMLVSKPILILDPIYENITKLASLGAVFSVCNKQSFEVILKEAKNNPKLIFKVHLKVNTGMNRFGFCEIKDIANIFEIVKKVQNIVVCGVFSHYFDVFDKKFAKLQHERFLKIKQFCENNFDIKNILFHISNSDGIALGDDFDMARAGMICYSDKVHSTVKLTSKILDFQILKTNESAGYKRVFVAKQKTKLAIVGIGYADGVPRNIAGKGFCLVDGNYAKIVAVCMDSILIDVTKIKCKICDEVVLFGKSKNKQIFVCDVASWCDTIDYEIISRISSRVKRVYKRWVMQIITGKYRARKLVGVDAETTRPTLARVKESIFNLIQGEIAGSVVLDLFAGSGAFGAECISRGASKVYFVDHEPKAIKTIKINTKNMNEDFEVLNMKFVDALSLFEKQNIKFDLVYLDPPYKSDYAVKSLEILSQKGLLNPDAIVVVEHEMQNDLQNMPDCYIIKKSKKYGIAYVDVLTLKN